MKADKLSGNDRSKAEAALRRAFPTGPGGVAPFLVSSVTGLGIKELWRHVDAALRGDLVRTSERWDRVYI